MESEKNLKGDHAELRSSRAGDVRVKCISNIPPKKRTLNFRVLFDAMMSCFSCLHVLQQPQVF